MKNAYVLSYMRLTSEGTWAGMFIGVYSSLANAETAKADYGYGPAFNAPWLSHRQLPGGRRLRRSAVLTLWDPAKP